MLLSHELKKHGGKIYNNAKKDVKANRRGVPYEPTPSINGWNSETRSTRWSAAGSETSGGT
jgi:hypothetical protein